MEQSFTFFIRTSILIYKSKAIRDLYMAPLAAEEQGGFHQG